MSTDQGVSLFHLLRNRYGLIKKSICFIVSPCFVRSIDQGFWSVSSCFRVFPIYLNHFVCYETEKKVSVSPFHFVSPCFVTSYDQVVGLFHPVSEFSLYILFVSFVMKQK